MSGKIKQLVDSYSWGLPFFSAFLLIFSVPPIDLHGLVFVGLVPMFLFTYFAPTKLKICLGWGLFAFIHAGYLTYSTLSGFHWLTDAELFTFFVQFSGFLVVLIVVSIFIIYAYVLGTVKRCFKQPFDVFPVVVCFLSYVVLEYFFYWLFSGFNYGALFFSAQNIPYVLNLMKLGTPVFISIAVLIVNIFILLSILYAMHIIPRRTYMYIAVLFICLTSIPAALRGTVEISDDVATAVSVAIIQETGRNPDLTFGYIIDGEFTFPVLEGHIEEAQKQNPDFIIYPFAPWSGVLGDTLDNTRFDREVITMDDATFSRWLNTYVPEDVIFVSWYTSFREGNYYNQIGFFKNGELISKYSKEKLFPFFDYTPKWALDAGIVSLPYDGTPGVNNEPFIFEGLSIGSLICSEIGDAAATENSATGNDMIFSLGSETMFSHEIPGEYNARQAQLSAVKHRMPIIRANKFGPSVVYDKNGKGLGRIGYNETGVLFVDIPVSR
jgi:apolipoprotein N-acyltransferase